MKASDTKRAARLAEKMGDLESMAVVEDMNGTAYIKGQIRNGRSTTIFSSIATFELAKELAAAAIGMVPEAKMPDVIRFRPRSA